MKLPTDVFARAGRTRPVPGRKSPEHVENEYQNPVEWFAQLPEPTREWLEQLREDDLKDLTDALKFYHDFKSFRRFTKWLIITVVGIFVGAIQFGEGIQKVWQLIKGGAPR